MSPYRTRGISHGARDRRRCVDKVPNRFELVLLAAHRRARSPTASQITIEPENDKNPVIALREIAEKTIPPEDMREGLIHSIQKNVEVDEPEKPPPRRCCRRIAARCSAATTSRATRVVDVITEEQLLRGMESMTPTEPSANGGGSGGAPRALSAIAAPLAGRLHRACAERALLRRRCGASWSGVP